MYFQTLMNVMRIQMVVKTHVQTMTEAMNAAAQRRELNFLP